MVNGQGSAINPLTGVLMNKPRNALAVYLPESDDADADSLPDWWERRNLGTLAWSASDDPDSDGHSNWQEWRTGTNPADATSVLRLTGQVLAQNNSSTFTLQWPSTAGKWYRIYCATNLSVGYSCIVSNLAATPPLNQVSLPVQPGAAFFRIQLE